MFRKILNKVAAATMIVSSFAILFSLGGLESDKLTFMQMLNNTTICFFVIFFAFILHALTIEEEKEPGGYIGGDE